ncbi:MAG: energy-coupling factor ABC transporter permease [Magnetococcales bacterium]|nr:energy-coupling factor ABC transporter permease [Magnetococcales bacterium]
MHIEPGFIAPVKLVLANLGAVAILGRHLPGLLVSPILASRTLLAALFFSLFMQSFHLNVGPSELHFVGAMALYLTLGFTPTLFGFALGLLLQGLIFEPGDLPHLAVNSLSLVVPLIAVHHTLGKGLLEGRRSLDWREIVRLDALYYAGVTTMVGFWLMIGEGETPFASWVAFAASYLGVVVLEPVVTMTAVRLLKQRQAHLLVDRCFSLRALRVEG